MGTAIQSFGLACLLLTGLPAHATVRTINQPAGQKAQVPATMALEKLMAAMNDKASTGPFVRNAFSSSALLRGPADQRTKELDQLKSDAGGFTLLQAKPEGERMVEAWVGSRRGKRFGRFVLFTSNREPGKINDLFVLPERDPARAAADRFPERPVTEQQLIGLVRKRLDALSEEGLFSGAMLIARGDKVVLREARGLADASWGVPNRTSTRFNIASVSKMWTAVALLKLVEQGKVGLDDTLSRWVPTYPHREAAEKITIRQLLQHRGGLGEWDGRSIRSKISPAGAAATMTAEPGPAGQGFAYSNAGYVLLGAVIEAASGLSFEEAIAEHVFRPAAMANSGYWPVTAVVPNRATGYLRPGSDPLGFGPVYSNEQFLGYGGDPSGGSYSTVDDLFAFHRALATGRLLNARAFEQMTGMTVEFPGAPRPMRYGLGLRIEPCSGVPTLGHTGGGAGSGTSALTYATMTGNWTVIVLANTDAMPESLALEVCELVHRAP
jgi:CubicO group peptidase (beta-lactamase class C family)